MAVTLALLAAIVYGAADFFGGVASRRTSSESVVLGSQLGGLVLIAPLVPLFGGTPSAADAGWGALAGIAGGVGVLLLYRALAIGTMGVVSPITAVIAAVLPVVAGLVAGERPAAQADIGMLFAAFAVVLVSAAPAPPGASGGRGVPTAIGAGVAIGLFLVIIARTSPHAGLYPLLAARASSVAVIAVGTLVARRSLMPARGTLGIILTAGALDMAANALYLLAAQRGMLAIVATLTGLYPASTVVLAATVLRERLQRMQWAGAALALGGVTLITL